MPLWQLVPKVKIPDLPCSAIIRLRGIQKSNHNEKRSSKINIHLFFLNPFCELLLLFASCWRSRSICCWAFQAGHHFPCQAIILPTIVAGFSLAYRHKRHPSHALPRNCSSRFIFDLQCSRKFRDRENLQSNRVTAKIESSFSFVLNGPV